MFDANTVRMLDELRRKAPGKVPSEGEVIRRLIQEAWETLPGNKPRRAPGKRRA